MIGRPAATMDPNISSRMTAAASSPKTSDPIGGASALMMDVPVTATVSPSPLASFAMRIKVAADSCGMSSGSAVSRRRVATMVVPSAEIAPGSWYGSANPETCGTAPAWSRVRLIAGPDAGCGDGFGGVRDQGDGVVRGGREPGGEQVLRGVGIRSGGAVVGAERARERGRKTKGHHECGQPQQDGAATVAKCQPGQAAKRARPEQR